MVKNPGIRPRDFLFTVFGVNVAFRRLSSRRPNYQELSENKFIIYKKGLRACREALFLYLKIKNLPHVYVHS
jgi:hypothetical protein